MTTSKHKHCVKADTELQNNPVRATRNALLNRCGVNRSTYYYGIKHGTITLEMFCMLADEAALTDEQIISVVRGK